MMLSRSCTCNDVSASATLRNGHAAASAALCSSAPNFTCSRTRSLQLPLAATWSWKNPSFQHEINRNHGT